VSHRSHGRYVTVFCTVRLAPKTTPYPYTTLFRSVSGDTSLVKNCKDWDQLKESPLASYTLSEGEEVNVSQLSNLGANFNNGKLRSKAHMSEIPSNRDLLSRPTSNKQTNRLNTTAS